MSDPVGELPDAALIWCPFGDEASAMQAASTLVEEQLAACANIVPAVVSVFRWEGRVQHGSESAVLFKTTAGLLEQAIARLAELHPYTVPAILGWRVDKAPVPTLEWLAAETRLESRK